MASRRLLLLSNSRNADGAFLAHAVSALAEQLRGVRTAGFVPFAGVTIAPDDYTARVRHVFAELGVEVRGVHESPDPRRVLEESEAVVVGGGNTFRLLERMQRHDLLAAVRERVAAGAPYVGWSAGSVLACPTIGTTNDMPIIAPQGFGALALVAFQVNAHFTDAHPPGFRGETRRERLAEYGALNPSTSVVGLPEGNWLSVDGAHVRVHGPHATPWFRGDREGVLPVPGTVHDLLEPDGAPAPFGASPRDS